MNGALTGFRVGGENKLMRLHGLRSCEAVLTELQAYVSGVSDAALRLYAQTLKAVAPGSGVEPTALERQRIAPCCSRAVDSSAAVRTWADVFAAFAGLSAWRAGLPYMPAALEDYCADVQWAFVIDVDAGQLQVFDNRNARYRWSALGHAEIAFCLLPLDLLRQLLPPDLHALHVLLQQHVVCDGHNPQLPLPDGLSPAFAGPPGWEGQLRVQGGRVQLLLGQQGLQACFNRVGELRLDDPGSGAFLAQALEPAARAMVFAIYGASASLTQLARLGQQMDKLPFPADACGLPLLDLGLRPSCKLDLTLSPRFFDDLKALFLAQGMAGQGWRFLIKQDHAVLRLLLKFFPPSARVLPSFTHFINLLASAMQGHKLDLARFQAGLSGVERILDRTRGRPEPVREDNARIFMRALMRAPLPPEELANLDHDAQDISDYVYSHAGVLKGATWRSLRRRSEAWHRSLLIRVDQARDVRWPALLPRLRLGEIEAIELDCGYLLAEEGLEQRHCIASYVNACSSGASRVFSLRRQGRRMATMELQRSHDGAWALVQIRGKANSRVTDQALLRAADDVAQHYTERSRMRFDAEPMQGHAALQPGAYVHPAYVVHRQDHWTG